MDNVINYTSILLNGLPVTLLLSFTGIVTACILSVGLTYLLTSKSLILTKTIRAYITLFTGTPLLVQLFLIYYGPAQFSDFLGKYLPTLWALLSYPWFCAYLALVFNSTAYTTLIFYGALKAVPVGQWQACTALGMNKKQSLKVIIPYALKRSLSAYSNEVIFVVKGTALASTITLMDLMGYNQYLNGKYYDFSVFLITGSIYLLINGGLSIIMRILERRALRFESTQ